jgi:hypothetical protein
MEKNTAPCHFDRSHGQSHRLWWSGETRFSAKTLPKATAPLAVALAPALALEIGPDFSPGNRNPPRKAASILPKAGVKAQPKQPKYCRLPFLIPDNHSYGKILSSPQTVSFTRKQHIINMIFSCKIWRISSHPFAKIVTEHKKPPDTCGAFLMDTVTKAITLLERRLWP